MPEEPICPHYERPAKITVCRHDTPVVVQVPFFAKGDEQKKKKFEKEQLEFKSVCYMKGWGAMASKLLLGCLQSL